MDARWSGSQILQPKVGRQPVRHRDWTIMAERQSYNADGVMAEVDTPAVVVVAAPAIPSATTASEDRTDELLLSDLPVCTPTTTTSTLVVQLSEFDVRSL